MYNTLLLTLLHLHKTADLCFFFKLSKLTMKSAWNIGKLVRKTSLIRLPINCNRLSSTQVKKSSLLPNDGKSFKEFMIVGKNIPKPNEVIAEEEVLPGYLQKIDISGHQRKVYFDVYGCQMNVNDTEIVWSILQSNDYQKTNDIKEADVILLMTCSIREGAESKVIIIKFLIHKST